MAKKIKKKFIPSEHELKLAVRDIKYEYNWFNWCFTQLISPTIRLENHQTIFIELLLLHCRNLLDFFVNDLKEQDDVLAIHYIDQPDAWLRNKWNQMPYLKINRNNINKFLSHLTYSRIYIKMVWEYVQIHQEINFKWNEFLDIIPNEKRCWFK